MAGCSAGLKAVSLVCLMVVRWAALMALTWVGRTVARRVAQKAGQWAKNLADCSVESWAGCLVVPKARQMAGLWAVMKEPSLAVTMVAYWADSMAAWTALRLVVQMAALTAETKAGQKEQMTVELTAAEWA